MGSIGELGVKVCLADAADLKGRATRTRDKMGVVLELHDLREVLACSHNAALDS